VQPPGLCMPLQEQASSALHSGRPAGVGGVQSISPGVSGGWCAHNDSNGPGDRVVASDGPADNSSYSAIRVTTDNLGLFANTIGGSRLLIVASCCTASALARAALVGGFRAYAHDFARCCWGLVCTQRQQWCRG
jgi:hypothetical protein